MRASKVILATPVLIAASLLAACGGSTAGEATPAPPAERPAAAPPAPAERSEPQVLPLTGGIPPGAYVASDFAHPFSLQLGEGWFATRGSADTVMIQHGLVADHQSLTVFTIGDLYAPDGSIVSRPDDMVAWLSTHPDLRVDTAEEVTVGDLQGVAISFEPVTASAWVRAAGKCSSVPSCVPLTIGVTLQKADTNRLVLLDRQGETVAILISGRADPERRFLQDATDVLNTIRFR